MTSPPLPLRRLARSSATGQGTREAVPCTKNLRLGVRQLPRRRDSQRQLRSTAEGEPRLSRTPQQAPAADKVAQAGRIACCEVVAREVNERVAGLAPAWSLLQVLPQSPPFTRSLRSERRAALRWFSRRRPAQQQQPPQVPQDVSSTHSQRERARHRGARAPAAARVVDALRSGFRAPREENHSRQNEHSCGERRGEAAAGAAAARAASGGSHCEGSRGRTGLPMLPTAAAREVERSRAFLVLVLVSSGMLCSWRKFYLLGEEPGHSSSRRRGGQGMISAARSVGHIRLQLSWKQRKGLSREVVARRCQSIHQPLPSPSSQALASACCAAATSAATSSGGTNARELGARGPASPAAAAATPQNPCQLPLVGASPPARQHTAVAGPPLPPRADDPTIREEPPPLPALAPGEAIGSRARTSAPSSQVRAPRPPSPTLLLARREASARGSGRPPQSAGRPPAGTPLAPRPEPSPDGGRAGGDLRSQRTASWRLLRLSEAPGGLRPAAPGGTPSPPPGPGAGGRPSAPARTRRAAPPPPAAAGPGRGAEEAWGLGARRQGEGGGRRRRNVAGRALVTYGHPAPIERLRSDPRRSSGAPVNRGWLHAVRCRLRSPGHASAAASSAVSVSSPARGSGHAAE